MYKHDRYTQVIHTNVAADTHKGRNAEMEMHRQTDCMNKHRDPQLSLAATVCP